MTPVSRPIALRVVGREGAAQQIDAFADVYAWWRGLSVRLAHDVADRLIGEGQSGQAEVERAGARLLDRSGDFLVELDDREGELVGLRTRIVVQHPVDSRPVLDRSALPVLDLPTVFSRTTLLGSFCGSDAELVAEDDDAVLLHVSSGPMPASGLPFGRTGAWRGWVKREDFLATNAKTVVWGGASAPGVRVGTWVEVDGRLYPLRFPDRDGPLAALDSSFPEFPRVSVASPRVGASAAVPWSAVTAAPVFGATAEVSGVPVQLDASVWPWRMDSIRVKASESFPERAPDGYAWRLPGSDPTVAHVRYVDLDHLSSPDEHATFRHMSYTNGSSHWRSVS